jgi:hypothetical protein
MTQFEALDEKWNLPTDCQIRGIPRLPPPLEPGLSEQQISGLKSASDPRVFPDHLKSHLVAEAEVSAISSKDAE